MYLQLYMTVQLVVLLVGKLPTYLYRPGGVRIKRTRNRAHRSAAASQHAIYAVDRYLSTASLL
jgi:hypothetical protein